MKYLLLLLLAVGSAAAQQLLMSGRGTLPLAASGPQTITFSGTSNLLVFSRSASTTTGATINQTTNGYVEMDSVDVNKGTYSAFGTNVALCTLEAEVAMTADYPTANPDDSHVGVGIRFSTGNDFGSWVGLDPATDQMQVIDRVGGAESRSNVTISAGLNLSTRYRIRIDNTNGNDVVLNLWNAATGSQLLTNWSYTMLAGVPATGVQFAHTFTSKMAVYSAKVEHAGAVWGQNSPRLWVQGKGDAGLSIGGATVASDKLTLYSNGSLGSVNSWTVALSHVRAGDATITGTIRRDSSTRISGIAFRFSGGNGDGLGYAIYYDTSGGLMRLAKNFASPSVIHNGPTVTMTTGTDYPFTLTLAGTNITWTMNGVTWSTNDASYATGFIGVMGYQSQVSYGTMTVRQ
jgi:hypothetical protein